MTVSWKALAAVVAAVLVLGFGWLKAHDRAVANRALADARADSLRTALNAVDTLTARLAERDLALAAAQHDAQAAQAVAQARLADMTARVAALRGRADVPPETLIVALDEEVAACKDALTSCEEVNVITLARIAVRDTTINELKVALATTRTAWEAALRESRPGFLKRFVQALPYVAGALAVGVVAGIVVAP